MRFRTPFEFCPRKLCLGISGELEHSVHRGGRGRWSDWFFFSNCNCLACHQSSVRSLVHVHGRHGESSWVVVNKKTCRSRNRPASVATRNGRSLFIICNTAWHAQQQMGDCKFFEFSAWRRWRCCEDLWLPSSEWRWLSYGRGGAKRRRKRRRREPDEWRLRCSRRSSW